MIIKKKKVKREREQRMTPVATASRVVEKSRIVAFAKPRRVEQRITSFLIARLGEGKIMELIEKNNFRIFFHSLV